MRIIKGLNKKITLFLILLVMGSACHASIVFQLDSHSLGLYSEFKSRPFAKDEALKNTGDILFIPLTQEMLASLLWEFNSHDGERLHGFTGLCLGLNGFGIPMALEGGMNFQLFETENLSFELCTALRLGYCSGLKGGGYIFAEPYVDFLMMSKSRRWLYGSIGIADMNVFDMPCYFEGFGWESYWANILSLHIALGLRLF